MSPRSSTGSTTSQGSRSALRIWPKCRSRVDGELRGRRLPYGLGRLRSPRSGDGSEPGRPRADHRPGQPSSSAAMTSPVLGASAGASTASRRRTLADDRGGRGQRQLIEGPAGRHPLQQLRPPVEVDGDQPDGPAPVPEPQRRRLPSPRRRPVGTAATPSRSSPRRTRTTSALEPCLTSPSGVSSQCAHCVATSSGNASSQSVPSLHQRGMARKVAGTSIIRSGDREQVVGHPRRVGQRQQVPAGQHVRGDRPAAPGPPGPGSRRGRADRRGRPAP